MPEAWSDKDERQYKHIKEGYGDDAEGKRIAAATVNKQRAKEGRVKHKPNVKKALMTNGPDVTATAVAATKRANQHGGVAHSKAMAAHMTAQQHHQKAGNVTMARAHERAANAHYDRYQSYSKRGVKLHSSLMKAMTQVQASPDAAKRPPAYLPGVHAPSSPMRPGKKPRVKKALTFDMAKDTYMHKPEGSTDRSGDSKSGGEAPPMPRSQPWSVGDHAPKVAKTPSPVTAGDIQGDTPGKASAKPSPSGNGAVKPKSLPQGAMKKAFDGDTATHNKESTMTTKMSDLFKGELGGEGAITKCVHCKHDLTKSDLEKGGMDLRKGGLGTQFVADDNDNPHSGGSGQVDPSRAGAGAKENDDIAPFLKSNVAVLKGPKAGDGEEYLITKGEMAALGMDVSGVDGDEGEIYTITKGEIVRCAGDEHIALFAARKSKLMKAMSTRSPVVTAAPQGQRQLHGGSLHDPGGNPLVVWDHGTDQQVADYIEKSGGVGFGQGDDEPIKARTVRDE